MHTERKNELVSELLGPLNLLLLRGEVAYRNYISGGKTFLYAKIIKDNNERIRQLILTKGHLLPPQQQSNAVDLVTHIDIWHVLWEDLAARKSFRLDEEFVFENTATFPRASVASLLGYYASLSEEE